MTSRATRLVSIASFLVLLVLFAANVARVHALQMHRYPPLWVVDAIPPAISDLKFNNHDGYTSLKAVSHAFYTSLGNSPRDRFYINRAISDAMALDQTTISRETELLGSDDKGLIDFVKIAFRAFGYKTESPMYLYFILLFLSGLLLLVAFKTALCKTFLAGFLVSHYLILPTVFYHMQLQSVLAPRFIPVLSILACLHCLFFIVRGTVTPLGLVALALQIALLVFVIHMRSVATWHVATIALCSVLAIARTGYEYYRAPSGFRLRHAILRRVAPASIPIFLISAGIVGLGEYRKVAYDERYVRGDQIVTRVFWHNILSGLAFNPHLAERYQIKIDDLSILRAVGRFMTDNGRAREWEMIGGTSEASQFRWTPYDRFAGEALVRVCSDQLGECVATITFYKPISLLKHLSWLYGFRKKIPDVAIFVSPELGNAMELQLDYLKTSLDKKTGLSFRLWNPLAVFMILAFSIILYMQQDRTSEMDLLSLATLALGTFIPTLVGYPSMHTIAEPAIVLAGLFYCGLAFLLGRRIQWQRHINGLVRGGAAIISAIRLRTLG